ncbi:MAG: twin-arginine translocation signal domain-containing protein, partial [Chloroflexi bacterium]|nr:twin-arginine translocation signal domain-containing protein [Chloroflexota bacterium]
MRSGSGSEAMGKKLSRRDFLYLTGGALGAAATGCGRREASSPGELPRYVDDDLRHGWPVPRGPYLQRDARIAAFWLPADGDALHRLCQRYLSAPTNGEWDYVPAMPYVAMLYAEMDVLSTDARDQALGHSRERELSFWAPVVGRRKAGGLWTPDHAAWFLPCLYVDNPSALVTVAVLMALFALVPGLPFVPFILGSLALGAVALYGARARPADTEPEDPDAAAPAPEPSMGDILELDDIHVEFAPDLINMVLDPGEGLDARIANMRRHIATRYGL